MTISDNVGIGTTAPNARLDIKGSRNDDQSFGLGIRNSDDSYSLVVRDDGNVGIGTTGPKTVFDVFKSDSSATNDPGNSAIMITASTGAQFKFMGLGYDATLNRGYIQPGQVGVAWGDLLLNPNGGNVGIGTTDPQAKLDIGGTAGVDGIRFPDGTIQKTAGSMGDSIMYLKGRAPAACPSGWTQADYQETDSDSNGAWFHTRTCFRTDVACRVMYLKNRVTPSSSCPSGWTQADYQETDYSARGPIWWFHTRTCFLCQ